MRRSRVIPCLTILDGDLVKTVNFKAPRYVGDPINAVKIFNELEVDELVVTDIGASRYGKAPDLALISDLASEAFMPIAYGGGVRSADQAARISAIGIEKIIVDSAALNDPSLIADIAGRLGSSSTVASISIARDSRGRVHVFDPTRRRRAALDPVVHARRLADMGAGELLLNDVDRDGRYSGYDTALIEQIADAVGVPVIACGGAATVDDLSAGIAAGASAAAAGSMFMFYSRRRGVLINYPPEAELAGTMP